MRHAPDPGQSSLFTPAAEPSPTRNAAGDPNIPMASHTYLRRDARPTSEAAAVETLPRSGTQRDRVWQVIRAAGPVGRTDQEIGSLLGLAENSVRPRRLELVDPPRDDMPRLVIDSGQRRQTPAGKQAVVWVAIEHAEEVARGA
jgi:hypothetical protein